jgi:hypothetical protein
LSTYIIHCRYWYYFIRFHWVNGKERKETGEKERKRERKKKTEVEFVVDKFLFSFWERKDS